jgi:glycosyltransferase involved in cell wall biosynthesis
MTALRVVHATECAGSGTLAVIVTLSHELAAAGARQHVVYSTRAETPPDVESLFPAGVTFEKVASARGSHAAFVGGLTTALAAAARELEPDVLHLHSSKAGFVGRIASSVYRWPCRVFYSPHGLSFLDPGKKLRNAAFRSLEWLAARTGSTPVGCGRGEADELSRLSGREARLLENPVDEIFFGIEPQRASTPLIVTMGRLSRQKAPENFALLARAVRARRPDARFMWIGDGEPDYRGVLEGAGVEITGWCNRAGVMAHLARAHVYAQTSRWEGLPISVIQALAAGVPCVVNDCIGNRDAVTNGVSGFVCGTLDGLATAALRLLDDARLRDSLGAAARIEAGRRFGRAAFRTQVRALYGITDTVAERGRDLDAMVTHAASA